MNESTNVYTNITTTALCDAAARSQQIAVDTNTDSNTPTGLQHLETMNPAVGTVRQLQPAAAAAAGIHALLDAATDTSPDGLEEVASRILMNVHYHRAPTSYDQDVAIALLSTGATDAEVVTELVERINHPTDQVRETQARELLRRALAVAASGIQRATFSPFQAGSSAALPLAGAVEPGCSVTAMTVQN